MNLRIEFISNTSGSSTKFKAEINTTPQPKKIQKRLNMQDLQHRLDKHGGIAEARKRNAQTFSMYPLRSILKFFSSSYSHSKQSYVNPIHNIVDLDGFQIRTELGIADLFLNQAELHYFIVNPEGKKVDKFAKQSDTSRGKFMDSHFSITKPISLLLTRYLY